MARNLAPLALAAVAACLAAGAAPGADAIYKEGGLIRVRPVPVAKRFRNDPWPAEMEEAFWRRANHAIAAFADNRGGGITGEHEKWTYPKSMFAVLAGNAEANLRALAALDGEHPNTFGVDFYWGFCLKNQPRKYFLFGKHAGLIDEAHLARMRKAAKVWTAADPRPTLELVLALGSGDADVREYALGMLRKIRPRRADLTADARKLKDREAARRKARGRGEDRKSNFEKYADYVLANADKLSDADLGADPARWSAWWKVLADGGWTIFEEFERRYSPRPHPKHGRGTGPVGAAWGPDVRGGWADARNTDNLRSMREACVYLFAEEVGSETVRKLYKEKLKRFVVGLYHVGMGEWDSETYHAHTIAPWLGVYDFAADPEVKLLAKAALDWLTAAAALKYYRGGYGGPTKRDYGGGNKVFGAGVSHMMSLYFGGCPLPDPNPHYDDVHAVTSAYRPPLAVAALARKDFPRPVELHDTKPTYSHWLPGADEAPEFWETLFFGRTYYLGTCVATAGGGDVGPFKLLAFNAERGCDFVVAYSGSRPNTLRPGDRIGQYRNLVIHLRAGAKAFHFLLPTSAKVETAGGIWFVRLQKTWLAVRPINLGAYTLGPVRGRGAGKYRDETVLSAAATAGASHAGYALEVGEEPVGYEAFKKAVQAKGPLPLTRKRAAHVLTGSDGRTLAYFYDGDGELPAVVCDGKTRRWADELDLYKPVGAPGPISLGWKTGTLRIEAGGHVFTQTVTKDGKVTFSSK